MTYLHVISYFSIHIKNPTRSISSIFCIKLLGWSFYKRSEKSDARDHTSDKKTPFNSNINHIIYKTFVSSPK